ncbi:MAG: hypothetical protein ACRC1K_10750, partial [Planctomycetia bacterium]
LPDDVQAQRDLGVSFERLGSVADSPEEQEDWLRQAVAVYDRLRSRMPGSAEAGGTLVRGFMQLFQALYNHGKQADAAALLPKAHAELRRMRDAGMTLDSYLSGLLQQMDQDFGGGAATPNAGDPNERFRQAQAAMQEAEAAEEEAAAAGPLQAVEGFLAWLPSVAPDNPGALGAASILHTRAANVLAKFGRAAEAIDHAGKALAADERLAEHSPDDPRVWNSVAISQRDLARFKAAAGIDPSEHLLGMVAARFKTAELAPDNPETLSTLIMAAMEATRFFVQNDANDKAMPLVQLQYATLKRMHEENIPMLEPLPQVWQQLGAMMRGGTVE